MTKITPELIKEIHQRMDDYLDVKYSITHDYFFPDYFFLSREGVIGAVQIYSDGERVYKYANVDDLYKSKEEILEDERQERLKQEQEREELARKHQIEAEQQEREEYERLKAKFEK